MESSLGVIMVLGLLAGGGSVDIVSTLPAKEYFNARDIEVTAEKLMELAVTTPDTSKKQIAQLMALSHLANDVELIKKSPNAADHRKKLGDITQGKLAADPANFASSYARKTLLALDGQKDPPGAKRSWKEGLKFLPEKATFVAFADLASGTADRKPPDLGMIFDILPKEDKEKFWTAVEKIGNMQIDSIGFALCGDNNGEKMGDLTMRFTGRGNPDWFISALTNYTEDKTKDRVGPAGVPVRMLVCEKGSEPAIAVIGSTEIIVGGYPPEMNRAGGAKVQKNHQEVVDRLLAQRAKVSQGPLQGLLKAEFAKIPADASGLVVGILTKEMRDGPTTMPNKVVAHAKRGAGGIDVLAIGLMADEAAAKKFVETVGNGRDQALQQFKQIQAQPMPPVPGLNIGLMIGIMESVQLQSTGNEAQLRVLLPDDMLTMFPMMLGIPLAFRAQAVPPPQAVPAQPPQPVPAPVPPKKVPDKK